MDKDSPRPFGWIRRDLTELIKTSEMRLEVAAETMDTERKKLEKAGLDAANAAMESKKKTATEILPRLEASQVALAGILHTEIEHLNSDQKTRLILRAATALKKVQEAIDSLTTHPAINTKQISISNVDNKVQVQVGNDAVKDRLKRFSTKVVEETIIDAD